MEQFYEYSTRKVADLIPYINNARTHSDIQVNQIVASISEWGFTNPVLIDENEHIIAGHGRVLAADKMKMEIVPVIIMRGLTEAQKKAYVLADNQLALNAGWDEEMLANELRNLQELNFDLDLLGFDADFLDDLLISTDFDDDGGGVGVPSGPGSLSERFLIPPFTVFNARDGWWQARKKRWTELGIQSEEGRDDDLTITSITGAEYDEKTR